MEKVAVRTKSEEARKSGALTPDARSVATARATFTAFESFIPATAAQLDTALRSLPTPAALAAVLNTANSQPLNHPTHPPNPAEIASPESSRNRLTRIQPALPHPAPPPQNLKTRNTAQSIPPALLTKAQEARSLSRRPLRGDLGVPADTPMKRHRPAGPG
jgi:hypothetical protein